MASPKIKNRGDMKIHMASKPVAPILAYVDNSNIFIEGKRFAGKHGGDSQTLRLHFENFYKLLARSRPVREVVWGGSIPPKKDSVWAYLTSVGIIPDLLDRASSGENETVDHFVQLRMHRHVRKYRDTPGTIVLCTGDGAGYSKEEGFLYDVEGFVGDGWKLELLSWTHCCHPKLRQFAETKGHYIPLERFFHSITFQEKGRRAVPVDFSGLPV